MKIPSSLRTSGAKAAIKDEADECLLLGMKSALLLVSDGNLMGLKVIEPHGINAVADEEWVEVDVKIDSGSTETAIPKSMLESVIDVSERAAFKRGVQYEVANGSQVPNLGERRLVQFTEDGAANDIVARVYAVNQGLMSVRQMTKKGNRAVFDDEGSYIGDKASDAKTWMRDEGGMYSLKMWVSRRSTADAGF